MYIVNPLNKTNIHILNRLIISVHEFAVIAFHAKANVLVVLPFLYNSFKGRNNIEKE